jgi:Zn-dependent M28 family amino/carboxypeptidase
MDLADPKYIETTGMQLSMSWNPERADRLLQGTGKTIGELLALAGAKKPLPRFPLDIRLRVKTAVVRDEVESQNVIGILPGSDPQLSREFVVLSAHLDHVGKTRVIEGDGIHNGAMDNASGIASLIEIAKMLRESTLKRSVAFVAVTGEEKGLRGSRYFATNPTLDGRMVANLNMDMFLPITELKVLRVLGLNESDLGPTFRAAAEAHGVPVQGDPRPERNSFIRSDQYSFVREGIPAINAGFGYQLGSPEADVHKKWLAERYHGVTDDTSQPVFKEDAAKFNRILADFAKRVADQPDTPRWNEDSFFRRFDKK